VSTVTETTASKSPTGTYFLFRRLHSLTGLVFGGYLVVHLTINATLVEGVREGGLKTVYQQQVDIIHGLPLLLGIEWAFIYLPIIYHTLYGIWIVATGHPNIDRYQYGKNWFYVLQRISAIILVFFILFHVMAMKGFFGGDMGAALTFDPTHATESTARHFNAAFWVYGFVYPLGILASCYHLANGFWTAAITWGLTVSKKSMQRWGIVCTFIFLFTLGCGTTALVSLIRMGPTPDFRSLK
jgi:succinate dehydrogenase / fumarate reductase cytochrome b subunit